MPGSINISLEAWRAMKHTLSNQLANSNSNQIGQRIRILIELCGALFSAVRDWVSHESPKES